MVAVLWVLTIALSVVKFPAAAIRQRECNLCLYTARAKIHNTLSDLGTSVSDVSSALGIHKAEFDIHKQHDLIPNPLGDLLPYVLIGGVALLAMRKR